MLQPRSCNEELYLPNSVFFSFSLILKNKEINVIDKKNQPKIDKKPENFQHKHVMFGKVRSKWEKDLTLAEVRQVS